MADELVSVVIPAFNAERTIDETLRSVRAQDHRALEIIVVDDGSRDATVDICDRHARDDGRIRIIAQTNAGVAAARNTGWQAAASDLIAFVDADDLWAPQKLRLQLESLNRAGERAGLVYCWYALIDRRSVVLHDRHRPECKGEVFDRLLLGNFVGNGSAALVRRRALIDACGFESGLHQAGAQGCEDLLFYCRVAEFHEFALVPQALVGYRTLPDNMSSDPARMIRSWMLVIAELAGRHPHKAASMEMGLHYYVLHLIKDAAAQASWDKFARICAALAPSRPAMAQRLKRIEIPRALALAALKAPIRAMMRIYRQRQAAQRFVIGAV